MLWKELNMDVQPWVDAVRKELQRQRMPRQDAARLLRELTDHAHDFMEDNRMNPTVLDLSASLGEPRELAKSARIEQCRRSWLNRHPWFTFGMLPVVLAPLLAVTGILVTCCGVGLVCWVCAVEDPKVDPSWLGDVVRYGMSGWIILSVALVLAGLWRSAARARLDWKWPTGSALLLTLLAAALTVDAKGRTATTPGMIMFGVGYPLRTLQVVQLIPPLLIALAIVLHARRERADAIQET
jgi:hypothetical protein